jgi:hypothetical protein
MPKWLQGTFAPTLMLWLYALTSGIASAMHSDGTLPGSADYVARAALGLIMASWVHADAQKRQRRLCYDYDSFVFFAWPIVVPVYLFRTRGLRAFLTLLCFAGICLLAILAAAAVFMVQDEPAG